MASVTEDISHIFFDEVLFYRANSATERPLRPAASAIAPSAIFS